MNTLPEVKVYWGHKKKDRDEFMRCLKACTIPDGVYDLYVGFAVSPSFEEAVPIVVEDEHLDRSRMLFAGAMIAGIAGKDHTIIALHYRFYTELQKNERLEALIDHELGHICCGHLADSTLDEVQKERVDQQMAGQIAREELEADQFAMSRRKKADMVYVLRYMMNNMDRYFDERGVSEKWRQAAKLEVEGRMRMLGKMG